MIFLSRGSVPLVVFVIGFTVTVFAVQSLYMKNQATVNEHQTVTDRLVQTKQEVRNVETRPRHLLQKNSKNTGLRVSVSSTRPSEWSPPTLPNHLQGADQANPELIEEIRKSWILAPDSDPLNLTRPNKKYFSQAEQDMVLDNYFQNKTNGFYIECGAYTGEEISNTLYFERERGWRGLLIEANPTNFEKVVSKHRTAYMLNACLSPSNKAETLTYTNIVSHPFLSRLESNYEQFKHLIKAKAGEVELERKSLQCFPFYSIMAALGHPHVDFFSLDIEGAEESVMRNVPFDKLDIDVLVIETGDGDAKESKVERFAGIMEPFGYSVADMDGDTFDIAMIRA